MASPSKRVPFGRARSAGVSELGESPVLRTPGSEGAESVSWTRMRPLGPTGHPVEHQLAHARPSAGRVLGAGIKPPYAADLVEQVPERLQGAGVPRVLARVGRRVEQLRAQKCRITVLGGTEP